MFKPLSDLNRRALFDGFKAYSPSLAAMLSWGLVTGIAMSKSALSLPQALGMSLLVYAGSAQLAVLPLLAAKLPVWTVLLTAAMVNTRFVIFSAGLAPHFSYLGFWRRTAIGFLNGDILYLLFMRRGFAPGHVPGKEAFFLGMGIMGWVGWQVSSIAGILLASLFPDSWGLELAGTLALIPIMMSAINSRSALAAFVVASVTALLAFDLPYRLGLPLAVLAALGAGMASDALAEHADLRRIRRRGAPAHPDAAGVTTAPAPAAAESAAPVSEGRS
jgi:predicted branched-subunit amino acid permease